jgi:magnesium-transporting ATPase (P-type)
MQKNNKIKTSFDISKAATDYFKNKILVVNGESLSVIMRDHYLKYHFVFIASLVPTLIGYNLTPEHKGFLTSMIKNYFLNSPTVLAVGDGYNDCLMYKEADISIEIAKYSSEEKFTGRTNSADILISNLSQIKKLLLIVGRKHSEQLERVIFFIFYRSFLVTIPLFIFNWYSSFTGVSIHDSILLFSYLTFFSSFLIVAFALLNESSDNIVLTKYYALYLDGF